MLFGWIQISSELRININKQDLPPRENIWRLPGLWLSWPNIFPELVQVGKRHQEHYVGLVDLWFPGAPLFSFDRAQADPFERQPLKMARTSPKAKAGVSPGRIGLQPIDTGNGLRTWKSGMYGKNEWMISTTDYFGHYTSEWANVFDVNQKNHHLCNMKYELWE